MAHFARIEDGVVTAVIVVDNSVITDKDGVEQEVQGQEFLADLFGTSVDTWVQCSYNADLTGFRGKYPGPGMVYDKDSDVFATDLDEVAVVAEARLAASAALDSK